MEIKLGHGGKEYVVRLDGRPPDVRVSIGDRVYDVNCAEVQDGLLSMIVDGRSRTAHVACCDGGLTVRLGGRSFRFESAAADDDLVGGVGGAGAGSGLVKAPMPGTVVKVLVGEGDAVEAGQSVVIVEAMKMENQVRAQIDGVIRKINVSAGDSVGTTEAMVEIEPVDAGA